jgi:hypothetical protein
MDFQDIGRTVWWTWKWGGAYLLDQHVEVLWDVGCEACMSLCQSLKTKAEALLSDCMAMMAMPPSSYFLRMGHVQCSSCSSRPPTWVARTV